MNKIYKRMRKKRFLRVHLIPCVWGIRFFFKAISSYFTRLLKGDV